MSWEVGDLALCAPCVQADCWTNCFTNDDPSDGPETGCVYRVTWAGVDFDGVFALSFAEFGHERFAAYEFRKIKPDAHEACEEEFVTLLRKSKRKVSA